MGATVNRPLGRAPFTTLAFVAMALTAGIMTDGAVRILPQTGARLDPIPDLGPMPEPATVPPAKPTVKRRTKAERRARNAKRRGKGK